MEERQPAYRLQPPRDGSHAPQLLQIPTDSTDSYRFLTTLHYDVADLKVPPPEDWQASRRSASGGGTWQWRERVLPRHRGR